RRIRGAGIWPFGDCVVLALGAALDRRAVECGPLVQASWPCAAEIASSCRYENAAAARADRALCGRAAGADLLQILLSRLDHVLLHFLSDPSFPCVGAGRAITPVPVSRRGCGGHLHRRAHRRPLWAQISHLVFGAGRAALYAGSALRGPVLDERFKLHYRAYS